MDWISCLKYQNPLSNVYVGSPSLIKMSNGNLLAIHDYFGSGMCDENFSLSSIYLSTDGGSNWSNITHIKGITWATLFNYQNSVYLIGASKAFGDIVIFRSDDYGYSWTKPVDEKSGILFKAGPGMQTPNYHCAPTPVVEHKGRIYRAFEDNVMKTGERDFETFVISCKADADLLDASNWVMSNKLFYNKDLDSPEWGEYHGKNNSEWLEGNIVEAPDGTLLNILRVHSAPVTDKAAIIRICENGKKISFDYKDFIDFPGGSHKFTIHKDEETGFYCTISNKNVFKERAYQRNVLSFHVSKDLKQWYHICNLMEDDQGLSQEDSIEKTGFQYVDWQFDGDDIIYLVRVAYNDAPNFHDSNYIVFNRIKNFREIICGGIN